MAYKGTFPTFDFENIWAMDEENGYPYLKNVTDPYESDSYVTGEIVARDLYMEFVIESYPQNSEFDSSVFDDSIINTELQNGADLDSYDDFDSVLNSMSEEAKEIYLDYILNYSPYVGPYYKEKINPDSISTDRKYVQNAEMPTAADILFNIERDLTALGLSTKLINSFLAVGTSLVGSVAENILPVAKIALVLSAAFTMYQIIINWDTVVENWDAIVAAFTNAFSTYVSPSAMSNEFLPYKTKTQADLYQVRALDIADRMLIDGYIIIDGSAKKHVSESTTIDIINNPNNTVSVYGSTVPGHMTTYLFVFNINDNIQGKINRFLNDPSTITYKHTVSMIGGKLYVLVDSAKEKIFHVHFSRTIDETHLFRLYESLNWQYLPFVKESPMYAKEYTKPEGVKGNGKRYEKDQMK